MDDNTAFTTITVMGVVCLEWYLRSANEELYS